jgi:hypothetical protein
VKLSNLLPPIDPDHENNIIQAVDPIAITLGLDTLFRLDPPVYHGLEKPKGSKNKEKKLF